MLLWTCSFIQSIAWEYWHDTLEFITPRLLNCEIGGLDYIVIYKIKYKLCFTYFVIKRHEDHSTLRHLPALYNKRNYCIHVHVYLFVALHVHLSIGLTVIHI